MYFVCIFMSLDYIQWSKAHKAKKGKKKQIYRRASCANWVFFSEQKKRPFLESGWKTLHTKGTVGETWKNWPTLRIRMVITLFTYIHKTSKDKNIVLQRCRQNIVDQSCRAGAIFVHQRLINIFKTWFVLFGFHRRKNVMLVGI